MADEDSADLPDDDADDHAAPTPSRNPGYLEVARIRDPDGVVLVVTERVSDGRISFTFAREFMDRGQSRQSSYLNARHIPAVLRLLNDARDRDLLDTMEDRARARRRTG